MNFTLLLGSSSPFRQTLLQTLHIPFATISPDIDETPLTGETAVELVERLAKAKAITAAALFQQQQNDKPPQAAKFARILAIGSDQVAVVNNKIVGKPLTEANAIAQLSQCSGQSVTFYTGLAVYDNNSQITYSCVEPFTVHFRRLSLAQIEYYVKLEQPLYCAGSFKCEGLGIALFERLEGNDPNSLIGLPLIQLINLLEKHNVQVLS